MMNAMHRPTFSEHCDSLMNQRQRESWKKFLQRPASFATPSTVPFLEQAMYEWMKGINGLELIKVEEDPEGNYQRVMLRVKDEKAWERRLVRILRAADGEDAAFSVAINKSFFLNEKKKPTFAWVLLVFGDFDEAEKVLRELITATSVAKQEAEPPPLVLAAAESNGVRSKFLKKTVRQTQQGRLLEVSAPLPHINHQRNTMHTRESKTGLQGIHGAAVDGLSSEPIGGITPNGQGGFDE
jgi:hypothetical protein